MRIRFNALMVASLTTVIFSLTPMSSFAQQAPASSPSTGQSPSAPTTNKWTPSRPPDGQPDLQGFWGAVPSGTFDVTDPRTGGGRLDELLRIRAGNVRVPKASRRVRIPKASIV